MGNQYDKIGGENATSLIQCQCQPYHYKNSESQKGDYSSACKNFRPLLVFNHQTTKINAAAKNKVTTRTFIWINGTNKGQTFQIQRFIQITLLRS